MFRFQPSVESLETRETPSGTSLASVTDLIIDSYNPSGPGVYKSVDSGMIWTVAPSTRMGVWPPGTLTDSFNGGAK